MANTVQSGSAIDTATWDGALPTGGEIAYVHHAITGPTGQLDCSLSFQPGGSLTVTGAFAITGGVANEQREPTPLVVPAGAAGAAAIEAAGAGRIEIGGTCQGGGGGTGGGGGDGAPAIALSDWTAEIGAQVHAVRADQRGMASWWIEKDDAR